MGLRLSEAKTMITHIEAGLDFLGWRIQRHRKRGTTKHYVYTYPAKKALAAITAKVKTLCQTDVNRPLPALLHRLNPVLRGWCRLLPARGVIRPFNYLRNFAWYQVIAWIKRKRRRITWKELRRRYCGGGWWPATATGPCSTRPIRHQPLPLPGNPDPHAVDQRRQKPDTKPQGLMESRMRGNAHVRFGRGPAETGRPRDRNRAAGLPHMVKIRDGVVTNRAACLAIGIDCDGNKQVLGLWVGPTTGESAKFWMSVLSEIKSRGVADVCIVCCDGLAGLPEAIETTWPQAIVQTSSVHTPKGGMVSPVTAPLGQDLCRHVPSRPSCRPVRPGGGGPRSGQRESRFERRDEVPARPAVR